MCAHRLGASPRIMYCGIQIRFTGNGNLCIVPTSLAPQWQQEIEKLASQAQSVIVLDGAKDRRRFMTSKDGLEECAPALPLCQSISVALFRRVFPFLICKDRTCGHADRVPQLQVGII